MAYHASSSLVMGGLFPSWMFTFVWHNSIDWFSSHSQVDLWQYGALGNFFYSFGVQLRLFSVFSKGKRQSIFRCIIRFFNYYPYL